MHHLILSLRWMAMKKLMEYSVYFGLKKLWTFRYKFLKGFLDYRIFSLATPHDTYILIYKSYFNIK